MSFFELGVQFYAFIVENNCLLSVSRGWIESWRTKNTNFYWIKELLWMVKTRETEGAKAFFCKGWRFWFIITGAVKRIRWVSLFLQTSRANILDLEAGADWMNRFTASYEPVNRAEVAELRSNLNHDVKLLCFIYDWYIYFSFILSFSSFFFPRALMCACVAFAAQTLRKLFNIFLEMFAASFHIRTVAETGK